MPGRVVLQDVPRGQHRFDLALTDRNEASSLADQRPYFSTCEGISHNAPSSAHHNGAVNYSPIAKPLIYSDLRGHFST